MAEIKVQITITAYCGYVSQSDIDEHIKSIADDIVNYAVMQQDYDYNRKITHNWDEQEDANLEITASIFK